LALPDIAEDGVVRQIDAHPHGTAVGVFHRLDRQVVKIQLGIRFLLPAVGGEILLEISVAIEQPDADQRHAQFAGALEMIAGEDSQAAGIDRQRFVQAELGGEIGDQQLGFVGVRFLEPAGVAQMLRRCARRSRSCCSWRT
jgi:hypothetical protein